MAFIGGWEQNVILASGYTLGYDMNAFYYDKGGYITSCILACSISV